MRLSVFIFGYQERERSKYHLQFCVAIALSSCASPFKHLSNFSSIAKGRVGCIHSKLKIYLCFLNRFPQSRQSFKIAQAFIARALPSSF